MPGRPRVSEKKPEAGSGSPRPETVPRSCRSDVRVSGRAPARRKLLGQQLIESGGGATKRGSVLGLGVGRQRSAPALCECLGAFLAPPWGGGAIGLIDMCISIRVIRIALTWQPDGGFYRQTVKILPPAQRQGGVLATECPCAPCVLGDLHWAPCGAVDPSG